jgi:very-short-patch-repair endonuclease
MSKKITTKDFINESEKKFKDRFTYENTIYIHNKQKVKINCKVHGEFEVSPNQHLFTTKEGGCTICGFQASQKDNLSRNKKEKYDFVKYCKNIFSNKYDYSKMEYKNMNTKVTLTCKNHGDFRIIPGKHKYSFQGCPECSKEENSSYPEKYFNKNLNLEKIQTFKVNEDYLRNKPFDFLIKRFSLIVELHGEQHYKKKWNMSDKDFHLRKKIDKIKKEKILNKGYNYLEVKNLTSSRLDKLIKILESSTTIENFKENIFSMKQVEYTQASGNGRHRKVKI